MAVKTSGPVGYQGFAEVCYTLGPMDPAEEAARDDEPEPARDAEPESDPGSHPPADVAVPPELDEQVAPDVEHAQTVGEWLSGKPLTKLGHIIAGLVTPLLIACAAMWRLKSFTVDDAYISYRYARNFARGLGLIYNPGERIEGYTNFLWTVLLGVGDKLGIAPTTTAKLLGFSCGLACVALLFYIESQIRPLRAVPALSPYLLGTTSVFMGYSIWGLETPLFAALLLGGVALMMREERPIADGPAGEPAWRRIARQVPWSGAVFGAAGLTRPEAPLYLGLMMLFLPGARLLPIARGEGAPERRPGLLMVAIAGLCYLAYWRLGDRDLDRFRVTLWTAFNDSPMPIGVETADRIGQGIFYALLAFAGVAAALELPRALVTVRNIARGGLFAAIVGAHLLWRKAFYGAWVPNTFTAKTGNVAQQLSGGVDYLKHYRDNEGSAVLALLLIGVGVAIALKHRHLLAFAAIGACALTYVAMVGGDWMPIYRFAAPIQPFLYLVAGAGARILIEEKKATFNWGLLLLALYGADHRNDQLKADRIKVLNDEKGFWDRAAGGVARWFELEREAYGRDAVEGALALGDIGQVGYETNLPIVDLLGLVDPVVAKLPGGYTNKIGPRFNDYFFERKPRYFVLISAEFDCMHPSVTGSIALWRDPRFLDNYEVSGRVLLTNGFSWCLYEHSDAVDVKRPIRVVDGPQTYRFERSDPQVATWTPTPRRRR